jgi:hypothetical protein
VAGQPQARRKPAEPESTVVSKTPLDDHLASISSSKKNPVGTDSSSSNDYRVIQESLLKRFLEYESRKSDAKTTENGCLKKNVFANSLIKKLLDETTKKTSSSAELESKTQNILSKLLGDKGDAEKLFSSSLDSENGGQQPPSMPSNITDLPQAPKGEVQYLREVLQHYSIPSSLVVPRDQLFNFFTYPILCFCSLLAKQTSLFGFISQEPDAILDGRVVVVQTKQLPDVLEHPKNYLPVILGSSLDDAPQQPSPESGDGEKGADERSTTTTQPDDECDSEKTCSSLPEPAPGDGEKKKPVPCLVKLPDAALPQQPVLSPRCDEFSVKSPQPDSEHERERESGHELEPIEEAASKHGVEVEPQKMDLDEHFSDDLDSTSKSEEADDQQGE